LRFSKNSSYLVFKHLDLEGVRDAALSIPTKARGIVIDSCTLGAYSRFGIKFSGYDSKITNNIIDAKRPKFPNDDVYYRASYGFEGIRAISLGMDVGDNGLEIAYNTVRDFEHANIAVTGGKYASNGWSRNAKVHHNLLTGKNIYYGGKLSLTYRVQNVEINHNIFIGGDMNQLTGDDGHFHHNIIMGKRASHLKTAPYNHGQAFGSNFNETGFSRNVFENNIAIDLEGSFIALKNKFNYPVNGNIIRNNIMIDNGIGSMVYLKSPKNIFLHFVVDGSVGPITNTLIEDNILFAKNGATKLIYLGGEEYTPSLDKLLSIDEAQDGRILPQGTIFRGNIIADPKLKDPYNFDFTRIYD